MKTLEIPLQDKEIRTGQPIFVFVNGRPGHRYLAVHPQPTSSSNLPFKVALQMGKDARGNANQFAEFSLASPGDYQIVLGNEVTQIHVVEQQYLKFQKEFGIFSIATLILVGGMVLWLKFRKKLQAGSI